MVFYDKAVEILWLFKWLHMFVVKIHVTQEGPFLCGCRLHSLGLGILSHNWNLTNFLFVTLASFFSIFHFLSHLTQSCQTKKMD